MATPTRPWSVKGIGEPVRNIARRQAQATGMPIGRWIDQAIQRRLAAPADDPLSTAALGELAAKVATSEQNIEAAFRPLLHDLRALAARVVAAEQALSPPGPAVETAVPETYSDIGPDIDPDTGPDTGPNTGPDTGPAPSTDIPAAARAAPPREGAGDDSAAAPRAAVPAAVPAAGWALPAVEGDRKPLGLFYSADPEVRFNRPRPPLRRRRRPAPIAPDADFGSDLTGLRPPPTAPTEDLSPAHVDPPAPPATNPQEPDPQVADAVSAARAATADAVDALTAAAERAAGPPATSDDDDAENPAAAPDQPRADFESLTDADSETTGAPDVASSPRRSRWGVWLLAVILLVALVAATLWTLRPALLAFGVAPPTVARVVAPLDQMRARTMAWVADLAGVAAAPPVGDAPVNAPANAPAHAHANAPANAPANPPANAPANAPPSDSAVVAAPPATAAREAVPPVEVPAPPPVADANPPTLAPSDGAAGRQMAAALARLADDGDGDPAAEAWAAQTLREAAIEGLAEAQ
ncbi:MAG: hypothetical protein VX021_10685, partial [Pseudomonadota bacterium]|nr:hypothetical protein [Pseudomonadota bacterium]